MDPIGNSMADGVVDLNALNGFDFAITLPENATLGYYNVYFTANGMSNVGMTDNYYSFKCRSSAARVRGQGAARRHGAVVCGRGRARLRECRLLCRRHAAQRRNHVDGERRPGQLYHRPRNWEEFTFGVWRPWWISYYAEGGGFADVYYDAGGEQQGPQQNQLVGLTDATGTHYLRMSSTAPRSRAPQRKRRGRRYGRQPPGVGRLHQPARASVGLVCGPALQPDVC